LRSALAVALLAISACSRAPVAPERAPARPIAMPGPARARGEEIARANAACESCHPDIAAEWRASLHRRAHVEPAYQRAFAIEPLPFCQGCHAPEAAPDRAVPPALADLGVGCVTCHDTGAGVLAGDSSIAHHAPHAVVRDARFASSDGCAGCHEFRFPGARGADAASFMQTTAREHANSAHAATRCAECHMPLAGDPRHPQRSHAFGASRDPASIRRAVRVTAARTGPRRLRVELAPAWVGHAFPTGDLFRRVEIVAEVLGPEMLVSSSASRYLTRHFELPAHVGGYRRLVADDRVGALGSAPIVVELDLGEAADHRPIAWRVAYQRVAHPRSIDARDALLDGEIEIAKGIEEATK
jgi:hypothetical protein